jgi:hypothetical protein
MSIKAKLGQLWTDSVAYVALLTGAGLSIAGNVANVLRDRGVLADSLDIVLAVAYPALVVLMVEVFVSSRWRGLPWPMQVLRWLGTLGIGGTAMRVSWVHLNELMLSRGQAQDVAVIGPLAIDALAIMATALILAGRGRVDMMAMTAADILAKRRDSEDGAAAEAGQRAGQRSGQVMDARTPDPAAVSVADEARTWLDSLADAGLDTSTTPAHPIEINPVSPAPSNTVKPENVPADAADMILAWRAADPEARPLPGEVDRLVASAMDVHPRTARRWRYALPKATA